MKLTRSFVVSGWVFSSLLIVLTSIQSASCNEAILSFAEFKIAFEKTYSDAEHHQSWAEKQGHDSRLGVNAYTDRHVQEMTNNFTLDFSNAWQDIEILKESVYVRNYRKKRATAPSTWDWRSTNNRVGPIRDQGDNCKADWAFAIASAIETSYAIKNNIDVETYSPQQILDCTDNTGYCLGGSIHNAAIFAQKYGVLTENSYRYVGSQQTCYIGLNGVKPVRIYLLKGTLSKLKQKIFDTGPVVINLYASGDFFYYSKGLFVDSACDNPQGVFSLAIIGYGTTSDSKNFWILRNSLGTSWGINGYMRLPIRTDNTYCGRPIEPIWMTF